MTDPALKHLKPKRKSYTVADRDGICVVVSPAGAITFRLDYRINSRRETLPPVVHGSAEQATMMAARSGKASMGPTYPALRL
ncbi:MAG TPA: Arm DNA-binding domain-containing protein [Caulobacter sp.]|nr:Arm DNA-binding domain-containing protein [Caulobacter sp.]